MFSHTTNDQQVIRKALGPGDALEVLSSCFHISLTRGDFWCLHDTEWLNDQVIH